MSATAVAVLWDSTIGKKVVMAVTGVVLIGFVFLHMAGNLKIFFGEESLNAYGEFLRVMGAPLLATGQALWTMRLILLASVVLHIVAAWQLALKSRAARPVGYARKDEIAATYAARTMRWGGVIVLLFVVYHLLHLTLGAPVYPGARFETSIYRNVVAGFGVWWVSLLYIVAQLALGLHLYHGTWSLFQTLGFNARLNGGYRAFATLLAVVVVVGNVSIPVAVLGGWLR